MTSIPDPSVSRRRFVGGATALAFAGGPRVALAASAPAFDRLVVVFTPNGLPRGEALQALSAHEGRMHTIDGLANRVPALTVERLHERGMATLLTGVPMVADKVGTTAGGPSIDILAAKHLPARPIESLHLGILTNGVAPSLVTPSFSGPRMPILPEGDPAQVFGGLMKIPVAKGSERQRYLQGVALKAARANAALVQPRVDRDDSARMAAYAETLNEVERQSAKLARDSCVARRGAAIVATDPRRAREIANAQTDLAVQALACDLTRVVTMVWEGAGGNVPFLPSGEGHRDLAVAAPQDATARARLAQVEALLASQVGDLVTRLGAVAVGRGSLLDRTLVLWCTEVGSLSPPSYERLPFILLGGPAGRARRQSRFEGQPHTRLLASVLAALGVPAGTLGSVQDPAFMPLPGLFMP